LAADGSKKQVINQIAELIDDYVVYRYDEHEDDDHPRL
jgi:hypothetical protein